MGFRWHRLVVLFKDISWSCRRQVMFRFFLGWPRIHLPHFPKALGLLFGALEGREDKSDNARRRTTAYLMLTHPSLPTPILPQPTPSHPTPAHSKTKDSQTRRHVLRLQAMDRLNKDRVVRSGAVHARNVPKPMQLYP